MNYALIAFAASCFLPGNNDVKLINLIVEKVYAIDDGPVVLKLILVNNSTKTFKINSKSKIKEYCIKSNITDEKLHARKIPKVVMGGSVNTNNFSFKPHDVLTNYIYLHHKYDNITSGEYRLQLTWTLYPAKYPNGAVDNHGSILYLSDKVTIDQSMKIVVEKKSNKEVKLLADEIQNESRLSNCDFDKLFNTLLWSNHEAFALNATQLLRYCSGDDCLAYCCRVYINDWAMKRNEILTALLSHLHYSGNSHDKVFFELWKERNIQIKDETLLELYYSKSIHISCYAIHYFPDQCPAERKTELRNTMKELFDMIK